MALAGCDSIPFIGGGEEEAPTAEAPATTPAAQVQQPAAQTQQPAEQQDPAEPPQESQTPAETAQPDPAPQRQAPVQRTESPVAEVPWTPTHTGTVDPGMTVEEVIAVWGDPVLERSTGEWTYLYFRNGCEIACGTYDVVLFESGHVADAIVRGPGHTYSGESSSPPGNQAQFTPPGG